MSPIDAEYRRVARQVEFMLAQSTYFEETPERIHSWSGDDRSNPSIRMHGREEVRYPHDGLGGPEFAPEFEKWLSARGVCMCEQIGEDGAVLHYCDRDERAARFRHSRRKASARRLNVALRQLRRLSPATFDIIFPIIARGEDFGSVIERVNDGRVSRGQEPYTRQEQVVHLVAGMDLLTAIF